MTVEARASLRGESHRDRAPVQVQRGHEPTSDLNEPRMESARPPAGGRRGGSHGVPASLTEREGIEGGRAGCNLESTCWSNTANERIGSMCEQPVPRVGDRPAGTPSVFSQRAPPRWARRPDGPVPQEFVPAEASLPDFGPVWRSRTHPMIPDGGIASRVQTAHKLPRTMATLSVWAIGLG